MHRWLGVCLCLLFLVWFSSGIVLMYRSFPEIDAEQRIAHAQPLDARLVRLTAREAFEKWRSGPSVADARLGMIDGRPVYRFQARGRARLVYADTGERMALLPSDAALRIAAGWAALPAAQATVELTNEPDQWTVPLDLAELRPVWKYSWPDGEQVYVSGATAEVVQATSRFSRFWAYTGAIPHWLYFTTLRKHARQWRQVMIWISAAAAIAAAIGLSLGIWMFSPRRRYSYRGTKSSIPYSGAKRWHMTFGLLAGAGALTWAFSGMLSMDPFARRENSLLAAARNSLNGPLQLEDFDKLHPQKALAGDAGPRVKELRLISFGGEPAYLAAGAKRMSRIIPVSGAAHAEFDAQRIVDVLKRSLGSGMVRGAVRLTHYDTYYADRSYHRPLPVVLARLNDAEHTRLYIDGKTGAVAGAYSSRDWVERWLYHGLHSLEFPGLYARRPWWDLAMLSSMLGGIVLSGTSVILAWRVLRRKRWRRMRAEARTR